MYTYKNELQVFCFLLRAIRCQVWLLVAPPLNIRPVCVVSGDHPEPPGSDQCRLRPRAGLSHRSHRLQVRRAEGEDRPPLWEEAGGQPQIPEVWRRRHRGDDSRQTHVCGEFLRVPAAG